MAEEQGRGVYLNDKQLVFGVMAATVVAVVVFLCGVFVGRGVAALRPQAIESSVADGRVVPDAVATIGDGDDASAAVTGAGGGIVTPPERLKYPELVGKAEPPAEVLSNAETTAPPEPAQDGPDGDMEGPATLPGTAGAKAPAPAPAVSAPAAAPDDSTGPFTVQVSAVRKKAEAQTIVDRLKKKGFPAFVFTPPAGDQRGGFRVRVGSFKSRQEAAAMASRLQKEKYQPWITR